MLIKECLAQIEILTAEVTLLKDNLKDVKKELDECKKLAQRPVNVNVTKYSSWEDFPY